MSSLQRAAETSAIIAAVALAVVVAGPGGALESLLLPIIGTIGDPTARLTELAFGITLSLLIPGLGLWAWGSVSRPAGTALALLASLVITVDLALQGRLTAMAWILLSALWLHVLYQVVTGRAPEGQARRPAALVLSIVAAVAPWAIQVVRIVDAQVREDLTLADGHVVVLTTTVLLIVLLVAPALRPRGLALAGVAGAVGCMTYALMSLRWPSPVVALPRILAIVAIATAVAYIDTVRQVAYPRPTRRPGANGGDAR